jgi:REP element-mobilizing transposase RayT
MQALQPNTSYHIFNHANGFENVFRHEANYYFFLDKYWKHIGPIAETYAYCLMPNHFHLVVRIRKRAVIEELIRNKSNNFSKVSSFERRVIISLNDFDNTKTVNFGKVKKVKNENSNSEIEKYLSKQFANLFSSYTQSFNKVYGRMGSLFIKNFKREPITEKSHFLNTVVYTHRNPIHHSFCKSYDEWPNSSYNEILQGNTTRIETKKLLEMTSGLNGFIQIHQRSLDTMETKNYPDIPFTP